MILPDRRTRLSDSLLGTGAELLRVMGPSQTVSELWDRARARGKVKTFGRFVQGLDLLFILGAVRLEGSLLVRRGGRADRRPDTGSGGPRKGAAPQ